MKRVIACALALCLTVCLFSVPAAAVSRDGILKWTMPLATSVDLIEMTHAEETADGPKNLLQQNVLTYEPNLTVRPMVNYGSTLYGRSTMSKIAAYLEDENLSLVAGVNGSFFDMSTGIPYGFVVTDGVLRTSGNVNSVGFSRNGGVIIGNPDVHIFVSGGRSITRKSSIIRCSQPETASAFTRATMIPRPRTRFPPTTSSLPPPPTANPS